MVVTAQRGGETFRLRAPVSLKEAADGNSFIPRLWARMHLDALLEQGSSQAIQDEIIALSEEYHIITPYTSLLVLETDADRERFKVKRRFQMRDGERFFADRSRAGELRADAAADAAGGRLAHPPAPGRAPRTRRHWDGKRNSNDSWRLPRRDSLLHPTADTGLSPARWPSVLGGMGGMGGMGGGHAEVAWARGWVGMAGPAAS